MSWIIALVLLFWLGMTVCKIADKTKYKEFQSNREEHDHQIEFIANLYVVAWEYYQDLEKQAISAWYADGMAGCPTPGYELTTYSRNSFGMSAEDKSIVLAYQFLRDHGIPVYKKNPNLREGRKFGRELIQVEPRERIDIEETALGFSSMDELRNIPQIYNFYLANHVQNELIKQKIPSKFDVRTYTFYARTKRLERPGVPKGYADEVRMEYVNSMREGKHQYHIEADR